MLVLCMVAVGEYVPSTCELLPHVSVLEHVRFPYGSHVKHVGKCVQKMCGKCVQKCEENVHKKCVENVYKNVRKMWRGIYMWFTHTHTIHSN